MSSSDMIPSPWDGESPVERNNKEILLKIEARLSLLFPPRGEDWLGRSVLRLVAVASHPYTTEVEICNTGLELLKGLRERLERMRELLKEQA